MWRVQRSNESRHHPLGPIASGHLLQVLGTPGLRGPVSLGRSAQRVELGLAQPNHDASDPAERPLPHTAVFSKSHQQRVSC